MIGPLIFLGFLFAAVSGDPAVDKAVQLLQQYENEFKNDAKTFKQQYVDLINDGRSYYTTLNTDINGNNIACIAQTTQKTISSISLTIDESLLGRALNYHAMRVKLKSTFPNQAEIKKILDSMNPPTKFTKGITAANNNLAESVEKSMNDYMATCMKCLKL